MLAEGTLSVTTARLAGKILTDQNQHEVLAAAKGRSKRDVEELIVRFAPRPDVPTTIRKVPIPSATLGMEGEVAADSTRDSRRIASVLPPPPPLPRPAQVAPLAPNRYELRVTLRQDTREKLLLAQDLLRHAIPSGEMSEILDRALALLLEDVLRKKFAATPRPRGPRSSTADSRDPSAEVKRAVYLRDLGRCAYVGSNGRRCNARAFLEFHHVKMYSMAGSATVDNISLRCAQHNRYEFDRFAKGLDREWESHRGVSAGGSTRSGTGAPAARPTT